MRIYIVLCFFLFSMCSLSARTLQVRQTDVVQAALPIYVGWHNESLSGTQQMYERFMACLAYSGQFDPHGELLTQPPRVNEALAQRFREGYMLAIYVQQNNARIKWRVYDVADGKMLTGKSFTAHTSDRVWVYTAAHALWSYLTGQDAPFLSQITYVRYTQYHNKPRYQVCVADFDGSHEQVIYTSQYHVMSPQWGTRHKEPVIFFSESMPRNVRVCMTDMAGNAHPLLDLDGTCVGFVQNGREIIYCRSGIIYRCVYDSKRGKRVHTPIVRENGPCASPTVDESGNLYYCYRGMIKHLDRKHNTTRAVAYRGYHVAPTYHIPTRCLAYAQRIDGNMQICVYDTAQKTTRQITHDACDTHDPRWSACGQYLIYSKNSDTCIYT